MIQFSITTFNISMRKIYSKYLLQTFLAVTVLLAMGSSANAQYCLPTYNTPCTSGDFINNVTFVTISNLGTGCGLTSANYSNYTSTINTTVSPGNSYPITVTPGPSWGQYFVAFIDFNQDNDFADAGEFFNIGYAAAGQTISNTIAIPSGAATGTTRLRVMCRYANTALTAADSCATGLSFGEVEDYSLVIIPPPPLDLSAVSVDAPLSSCTLDSAENLSVTFANYGLNNISSGVQLCYSLNNGPPVCEPFTGTINAGDSASYTFTSPINMSAPGPYNFSFWTSLSGDGNASNDTLNGVTISNLGTGQTTSVPYFEDFESSNGNWTTYSTSPANSWAWGQPNSTFITAAAAGLNAWVTNLTGSYTNSELSFLQSPCLDFSGLTGDPFIAFSHIYSTESCCDEGWLELSTNAGATWSKVGTSGTGNNWYNDTFAQEWDGTSGPGGQWRTADNQLVGSAGNSGVFIRFVFSSDGSVLGDGFGVDNVRILDTIINFAVNTINSPANSCLMTATESIEIEVFNAGTHIATNIPVCFVLDNNAAVCETITDTIQPGASYTYTFTATGDFSATGLHDLTTYSSLSGDSLTDNDTAFVQITNYPVITSFPHLQDFEGGQNNWASDGTNNDWEWGTPAKLNISGAASGTGAWVTGTTGFLTYGPNVNAWVESPCFDLTNVSTPWVGSKIWWESATGDGTVLEFSTDAGATWAEVGALNAPFNWYNAGNITGLSASGGSGNGWSGTGTSASGGYRMSKHDVSSLSGQSLVRFRFRFGSNGFTQADGFAFDDFVVANPPSVALGADTTVCQSLTLSPSLPSNGSYQWDSLVSGFSLQISTTPSITITGSGTYILTYTDSLGLCGMDTISVTINNTPEVDLGPDQNICLNDSITLSVDPNTYPNAVWSTSATSSSITVGAAGTYAVDVLDQFGCPSSDTIVTAIVPLPQFTLGPDSSVCAGDTFCLSSGITGAGYSYLWNTGATTQTICSAIVSGYWAIVIDSNNCQWADSIILTAAAPAPNAAANFDTTNCPVVSFTDVSTGTATGYSWNFGDGNSSVAQNPSNDYSTAGNGSYTVTFVAENGCGADTTTFTVDINCLVSITNGLEASLKIFPNPNQGRFRIVTELTGTVPVNVQITDLRGQKVYEKNYGESSGTFEEEVELNEAKGVYFVRFEAGGEVSVEKLIVE